MKNAEKLLLCLLVRIKFVFAIVDPCTFSGQFQYDFFIKGIPENQTVGSVIGVLPLTGGPDDVSLTQTSNPYLHLDVDSRNISLIKELDTDKDDNGNKLMSDLILQVICVPKGTTRKSSLTVRVLLEDINEHRPTFPKNHYIINLPEDTPVETVVFHQVTVTDRDGSGSGNDLIHFSILPGSYSDYFDIHILRTEVTLKKPLDYETVHSMTIEIEAKDNPQQGEPLSSKAFLTFNITDVDDLNPEFTHDTYSVRMNADTLPGSLVPILPPIRAYDGDSLNASLKYELVDPQSRFVIDTTTADVSVNAKLSDGKSTLVLKATQRDNPIRQGIALLQLTIIGQGTTLGPSFVQPRYHASLSENEAVGTTVITVTVTDHNQWTSLRYSLGIEATHFTVNNNGDIILTKKVDYEEKSQFIFNLTAADEFYSAWTTITITVTNVNDNGPKILEREITVNAERVKGSQIAIIKAVDKDPNTSLTFSVVTHKSLFAVSQEGVVSLTGSEDDYVRDEYVVVISVKDNGSPQLESVAVVTVAFPARVIKNTSALDMASSNDLIAIILGIVAAILLFVIIFLVIYIIRRRQFVEEQLDRAKIRQGMDPRGLTYQRGGPSPDPSSKMDINFDGELEETSDVDSHTTIQQNPLNFRLPAARQNGEIQIETAVIPYDDNFEYQNHMRTFHVEEISSNSDTSDSTGDSHKVLMEKHKRSPRVNANSLSWAGSNPPSSTFGSDIIVPEEHVTKEKPEITVYF
ncbi:protocadherin Fat 3-like isoform X1 [Saccostrea cucullata]|uniref:protocadherin Fat 3-like isoform X1 n=1 Tax=Saccostrea cuccullata TaxID=36930 RepID=UPI002ED3A33A